MNAQISIPFGPRIHDGKKNSRIGTACSEEFRDFFRLMCRVRAISESELAHEYLIRGMQEDLAKTLMPEPHLDKNLREILSSRA
jgi:hypothetical protein